MRQFFLADLFNKPLEPIVPLAIGMEILCQSVLSIDDLRDETLYRGGTPCSYRLFGSKLFSNANEFMQLYMIRIINAQDLPLSTKYLLTHDYSNCMQQLRFYLTIEYLMTKNKDFASFQQFIELDCQKNSGFGKLAALLVLRQCEVSKEVYEALLDFMTELALTFQVFNDINSVENEIIIKRKEQVIREKTFIMER